MLVLDAGEHGYEHGDGVWIWLWVQRVRVRVRGERGPCVRGLREAVPCDKTTRAMSKTGSSSAD